MANAVIRRHFPEDMNLLYYELTDRSPSFKMLKDSIGRLQTITLKNLETGELETLEFTITGATESPITTTKWIWGPITTNDSYPTDLIFDYVDGNLVAVKASVTPKSLPVEQCAARTKNVRYPAELTTHDIFSPVN